jgi:hypothetical protein
MNELKRNKVEEKERESKRKGEGKTVNFKM